MAAAKSPIYWGWIDRMPGMPPTPMALALIPLTTDSTAPTADPAIPQINGKPYFRFTPNMAGSVTPGNRKCRRVRILPLPWRHSSGEVSWPVQRIPGRYWTGQSWATGGASKVSYQLKVNGIAHMMQSCDYKGCIEKTKDTGKHALKGDVRPAFTQSEITAPIFQPMGPRMRGPLPRISAGSRRGPQSWKSWQDIFF